MTFKYVIIATIFFILGLLQTSFLPHLVHVNSTPNLIFIAFFVLVFFEKYENNFQISILDIWPTGVFLIVGAGCLLDFFSPFYIGPSIASLFFVYATTKLSLYFLRERSEGVMAIYFILIFAVSFVIYNIASDILINGNHIIVGMPQDIVIKIACNLAVAFLVFYLYKHFVIDHTRNRQLNLFNR